MGLIGRGLLKRDPAAVMNFNQVFHDLLGAGCFQSR
jgi:hypothetical protein